MSYVVLARKWRPQSFDDLIGQEHVSRTLANAIASDRVAHAFLFTGVRGVGKTTSARILAKALNCEKGPTASPCLVCAACKEIGDGVDLDVQEIDGASYTGIDAVRGLQETIPYRPARDRFKIYIVDEVHMLSVPAWNAFLKTLEEPPPHVKFIFATTEVNKVPVTILSRCQRYDFKLIGTTEIAARLRHVIDAEGVGADDEAMRIIAREAAGSMRDAMSLLDQVIAWVGGSGDRLTADGVARVLGVAARSVLHRLAAAVLDGQASAALDIVASLAEQGYALPNVARDYLHFMRDLVVAQVSDNPAGLIDLADDELTDLIALAKRSDRDDLSRIYLGFSRGFDDIVRSSQPRGAFEMALVRLACRPPLLPLDALLRRLAELEQRLAGPSSGGAAPAGGGVAQGQRERTGGGSRTGAHSAPREGQAAPESQDPVPNLVPNPVHHEPSSSRLESHPAATQPRQPASVAVSTPPAQQLPTPLSTAPRPPTSQATSAPPMPPHASSALPPSPARPTAPAPAQQQSPMQPSSAPHASAPHASAPHAFAPHASAPHASAPHASAPHASSVRPPSAGPSPNAFQVPAVFQTPAASHPANPTRASAPVAPNDISRTAPLGRAADVGEGRPHSSAPSSPPNPTAPPQSVRAGAPVRRLDPVEMAAWRAILGRIAEEKPAVASVFEHGAPVAIRAGKMVVGYQPQSFLLQQATANDAKEALERAAQEHFGVPTTLEIDQSGRHTDVQTVAQENSIEHEARILAARRRVEDHPLVTAAMSILGAELRDVRLPADFA